MTQNPTQIDKFKKLLEWQQEYRREQEKAQRATTYTSSSRSHRYSDKVKFRRVKFWNKEGKAGQYTKFDIYPESVVFGQTRKIFKKIPQKRSRVRDNDEVSESQDINHAVQKGIRKLKDEIAIRRAEEMIARTEQKKELKKTKLIMKQKK